jgi:hypothetical protein
MRAMKYLGLSEETLKSIERDLQNSKVINPEEDKEVEEAAKDSKDDKKIV